MTSEILATRSTGRCNGPEAARVFWLAEPELEGVGKAAHMLGWDHQREFGRIVAARNRLFARLEESSIVRLLHGAAMECFGLEVPLGRVVDAGSAMAVHLGLPGRSDLFKLMEETPTRFRDLCASDAELDAKFGEFERAMVALLVHCRTAGAGLHVVLATNLMFLREVGLGWHWLGAALAVNFFDSLTARLYGLDAPLGYVDFDPLDVERPAPFHLTVEPLPGETVSDWNRRLVNRLGDEVRWLKARSAGSGRPSSSEVLARKVDWLYEHRVRRRSIRSLARVSFGAVTGDARRHEVRRGIRETEELLGVSSFELRQDSQLRKLLDELPNGDPDSKLKVGDES